MPRIRLTQDPPLCSVEEAFTLLANAKAFMKAEDEGPFRNESHSLRMLKDRAASDASLVALEVAIDTGDPQLLSAALEGADEVEEWGRFDHEFTHASAAEVILQTLPSITNVARDCARSDSSYLRAGVARGLGTRALRSLEGKGDAVDAEAARMVTALLNDADPTVRKDARDSLGGMAPPAWITFFPSDPIASRSASEATRLRPLLDAAAAALEKGLHKHTQAFAEAVAALPDDLALPILESWIRTENALFVEGVGPLLVRWLQGDAEGERLTRWLTEEEHKNALVYLDKVAAALRQTSQAQCVASCLRFARWLLQPAESPTVQYAVGSFLSKAWPPDADRLPLLELVLGSSVATAAVSEPSEHETSHRRYDTSLTEALVAPGPGFAALKDVLIDAFVAGLPGRWKIISWRVTEALQSLRDPRLRAYAEGLLQTGGENATWALQYLTGAGHDPEVDPPIRQTLTAAIRHASTREAVLKASDLVEHVRKPLRAMLLKEGLTPDERIEIAFRAGDVKGQRDEDGFDFSEEEQRVIRTARVVLQDERYVALALRLIPKFPGWTQEDHEFVTRALHRFGEDGPVTITLARIFEDAATPALLPLAEELSRISSKHAAHWVRRAVQACRPKKEEA